MGLRPPTSTLFPYTTLFRSLAAVDVQNQIALAEPQLPQEVVRNGITVRKRQTAILVVGALTADDRSEEHTSELQSHRDLVCRLLLSKKKRCGIGTVRRSAGC